MFVWQFKKLFLFWFQSHGSSSVGSEGSGVSPAQSTDGYDQDEHQSGQVNSAYSYKDIIYIYIYIYIAAHKNVSRCNNMLIVKATKLVCMIFKYLA